MQSLRVNRTPCRSRPSDFASPGGVGDNQSSGGTSSDPRVQHTRSQPPRRHPRGRPGSRAHRGKQTRGGGVEPRARNRMRGKNLGVIGTDPAAKSIVPSVLRWECESSSPQPTPTPSSHRASNSPISTLTIRKTPTTCVHSRAGNGAPHAAASADRELSEAHPLRLVDEAERRQAALEADRDLPAPDPTFEANKVHPLRTMSNVVITSHLAGQTLEARERAGVAAAQAIIDVLDGKTPQGTVV